MSVDKDSIRRWYEANGMTYEAADWGARFENGESASLQSQDPERIGGEAWVSVMDPHVMHDMEGEGGGELKPCWEQRDGYDRMRVEAIEDFFETHLPIERGPRQEVLDLFLYDRASVTQVAVERGVTKQAVSQQRQRVLDWVKRELASQWPDPEGNVDQRSWAVFVTYWRDRFGAEWPNVVGPTA